MSISIESFVTHRISLNIPEIVLRDSIAYLLMNHLSEELKGADLEVLLDEHNNSKEARRRLEAVVTRMIQPFVVGEPTDELGRHVEIPFSFVTPAEL